MTGYVAKLVIIHPIKKVWKQLQKRHRSVSRTRQIHLTTSKTKRKLLRKNWCPAWRDSSNLAKPRKRKNSKWWRRVKSLESIGKLRYLIKVDKWLSCVTNRTIVLTLSTPVRRNFQKTLPIRYSITNWRLTRVASTSKQLTSWCSCTVKPLSTTLVKMTRSTCILRNVFKIRCFVQKYSGSWKSKIIRTKSSAKK